MASTANKLGSLFEQSVEPIFFLNARRQLTFANRAWEKVAGLSFDEVRGLTCKSSTGDGADRVQCILALLAPPADMHSDRPTIVRRRTGNDAQADWWDITFVTLAGEKGVLGTLGMIRVRLPAELPREKLLPEKLLQIRQRFLEHFDLLQCPAELPASKRLLEQAKLAARTDVPVSLVGPSGVGKHWLARALHQFGPRRDHPFARVDCGRVPVKLLEDWLLNPSSTRRPHKLTLYLTNLPALPTSLQVRVGQHFPTGDSADGPRLLAGILPGDTPHIQPALMCKLGTLTIEVPGLAERRAELPIFIDRLLSRIGAGLKESMPKHLMPAANALDAEVMQVLQAHDWPGNLRELHDVLRGACMRSQDGRLRLDDLPFYLREPLVDSSPTLPLDSLLEQAEKRLLTLAMRLARGNKTRAAEILQIWRPRVARRLEALGLSDSTPAEVENADDIEEAH